MQISRRSADKSLSNVRQGEGRRLLTIVWFIALIASGTMVVLTLTGAVGTSAGVIVTGALWIGVLFGYWTDGRNGHAKSR